MLCSVTSHATDLLITRRLVTLNFIAHKLHKLSSVFHDRLTAWRKRPAPRKSLAVHNTFEWVGIIHVFLSVKPYELHSVSVHCFVCLLSSLFCLSPLTIRNILKCLDDLTYPGL